MKQPQEVEILDIASSLADVVQAIDVAEEVGAAKETIPVRLQSARSKKKKRRLLTYDSSSSEEIKAPPKKVE